MSNMLHAIALSVDTMSNMLHAIALSVDTMSNMLHAIALSVSADIATAEVLSKILFKHIL